VNGAQRLLEGGNFIYFKTDLEVSGNLLNLAHRTFGGPRSDSGNYYMVAGLRYPQYIRPEADIRLYRRTGRLEQLVFRLSAGAGYAYGNNPNLPYQKKFFMGGANSIRAWRVRTIGPGSYNYYDSQPEGDRNLEYFYRVGDIKLEGNVEYRFRLLDDFFFAKLNGATFIDVGNTWDFNDEDPSRVFRAGDFYRQLAVGAGFGFRFDIDFLVFRLDFAGKIHDPQFSGSNRWVIGKIGDKAFKDRYNYNFFNLTLGIGYPF
ncbi:MAG TPA: BamA/TamA family outer membrane protein, partial [Anseongella sp.]|nr:BamA/TamA family outer membrane protein [Anseongella sp.]